MGMDTVEVGKPRPFTPHDACAKKKQAYENRASNQQHKGKKNNFRFQEPLGNEILHISTCSYIIQVGMGGVAHKESQGALRRWRE